MVLRLLEQGIEIVAWNRTQSVLEEITPFGAIGVATLDELVNKLDCPRIIWLMLPQGSVIDETLEKLIPGLNPNDLVIDGGNSFYKDTLRRNKTLKEKGIRYMDIGTSGGPGGARNGACLMIGGSLEDFCRIEPLAKAASAPGAYRHLGGVGAGHFAKMVHNGIEYGMMEAVAEGADVLKKSSFNYDLANVFSIYNNGSVIESRLVGWAREAFSEDNNLTNISSKINATGEGEWTINTAHELGVEVPVIEKSFEVRQKSSELSESFRDKVVSALRGKFGHHSVTKNSSSRTPPPVILRV